MSAWSIVRIQGRSTEHLLSEMIRLQGPPQDLDIIGGSIYANSTIYRGRKFGPYPVQFMPEPTDKQFAWEVSVYYFPKKIM